MAIELAKQQEVQERLVQTEAEEEKVVLRRIIHDYGEKILVPSRFPTSHFHLVLKLFFFPAHFQLYKQISASYERHADFPENIFLPKALGILSRWPFIDFFRDYLCSLVFKSSTGLGLPIERYLINLTREAPLPPRGKVEVAITLDRTKFYLFRPPMNKIPIIKNVRALPLFFVVAVLSPLLGLFPA